MPIVIDVNNELTKKVLAYAVAFLDGYHQNIHKYYSEPVDEVMKLGFPLPTGSIYQKRIDDVSIKTFYASNEFHIYFIKKGEYQVELYDYSENPDYSRDWTHNTPTDIKHVQVEELLNITPSDILIKVSIPGVSNYLSYDISQLEKDGLSHGNSRGTMVGDTAIQLLPSYKAQDEHTRSLIQFSLRYKELITTYEKPQKTKSESLAIGHKFEQLWRDILNYWDWQAKKIELDGERDDFTAMYKGNHIVGECRWVNKPQDADEVRAFAAKLNTRARSIGLMVAYSGFNQNALKQVKSLVHSGQTIVLFTKSQIDQIILNFVSPDEIMDKEYREVLDYLYEKVSPVNK